MRGRTGRADAAESRSDDPGRGPARAHPVTRAHNL